MKWPNPYEVYKPIVEPVKEIIKKEYRKRHTIKQLAKRTKVDIRTLKIAFKEGSVFPIRMYQTLVRIEKGAWFLQETDKSMSRIAHEVGYSSASTFSRQFKIYMEETPGAWRKKHQRARFRRRKKKA